MLAGYERFPSKEKIKIKSLAERAGVAVRRSSRPLVEPLVVRVEGGNWHIDKFQLSDRPVATAGLDQHRRTRPYRMADSIQFHLTFPLEEIIDFRQPLVVVDSRFSLCGHQMERGDLIDIIDERPSGLSARAGDFRNLIELTDAIKRFGQIGTSLSDLERKGRLIQVVFATRLQCPGSRARVQATVLQVR